MSAFPKKDDPKYVQLMHKKGDLRNSLKKI